MIHRTALVGLLVSGLVCADPSAAQVVGGGGLASTDCWVTYNSTPAPNKPALNPKNVQCADQDVTCGDANPTFGYCGFSVQLSLNDTTGFPSCTPDSFLAGGFLIPYAAAALGADYDNHPKNIAGFEPLQNFVMSQGSFDATDVDLTSGFAPLTIPLKIAFGAKGPSFQTTTVTLHPTLCQVGLTSSGKCPAGVPKDVDTFKLTCTPQLDSLTGKKVSPCTGITSTFQQIQEHIFDRKCASQPTCHGEVAVHNLCLAGSCGGGRSTSTDLVGVTPTNFPAASDGLKRVDPGNLATSLLYHKIQGGLQLKSTTFGPGAYGVRMPYHNPSIDRARPKLTAGEIRLIKNWILQGAPLTGFITSLGACH